MTEWTTWLNKEIYFLRVTIDEFIDHTSQQKWTFFCNQRRDQVTPKDFGALKTNPLSTFSLYVRISRYLNLKVQKWPFFSHIWNNTTLAANVLSEIHSRHRLVLLFTIYLYFESSLTLSIFSFKRYLHTIKKSSWNNRNSS